MIQYGLISKVDSFCLEKTLDLIEGDVINYCEVGLYNGRTASGVNEYLESKGKKCNITGVDNFADKEKLVFFPEGARLIVGNSNEVYNSIDDESQDLIFIDGNHAFPSVVADFFCFSGKIKPGGYMCFHDSGSHIKPFTDYQRIGNESDPDSYISVRKALEKMELLNNRFPFWKLIFDVADESDPAGGLTVLKKIR